MVKPNQAEDDEHPITFLDDDRRTGPNNTDERHRTNEAPTDTDRKNEAPIDTDRSMDDWGVDGGNLQWGRNQQCDAGRLLSRRDWKQMDASELTRRGSSLVAFGWGLMNFIPDGRVCKQNSFGKNPRRNPR